MDCTLYAVRPKKTRLRDFVGHINNLYNTTFWALVQKGSMDATQAEEKLKVVGFNSRYDGLSADLDVGHNSIGEERDFVLRVQDEL